MTAITATVRAANDAEWDGAWEKCDYAAFFQSREWCALWESYSRGRILAAPEIVEFSDGRVAVLPWSREKRCRGLVSRYISSPADTYGGWISADDLEADHVRLLKGMMLSKSNLSWMVNPYAGGIEQVGMPDGRDVETRVIDLSEGMDSIVRSWSKGHRSAAHKAEREGVTVRVASTLADWRDYFAAYEDSLRRWGDSVSSRYEWALFEKMAEMQSRHIRLWSASHSGRCIAGALCLYGPAHVVYWHGAALEEFFSMRPVHLVIREAMRDACEEGYRRFDFNPSGGHAGVAAFKKGFGGSSVTTRFVAKESGGARAMGRMASLVRRLHGGA